MVQRFFVRFWGVRGSYPTPGPQTLRYGGNTSCVEVQAGDHTLVFDAGSGIIRLGESLLRRANGSEFLDVSLFFSHAHGDHLVGFPFFAPLFDARTRLHLFGPRLAGRSVEQIVTPLMSPPYFPVDMRTLPSQRTFHTIRSHHLVSWESGTHEPQLEVVRSDRHTEAAHAELCVTTNFTRCHPLDGAVNYCIEYGGKKVVYATDVEWEDGCDPEFLDFVEGADLLIHDAQYTIDDYEKVKHGYGHSTVEMAVEAARTAHVHELILFHHEPTYDDNQLEEMEREAQAHFAHTRSAREGMEIDLLAQKLDEDNS